MVDSYHLLLKTGQSELKAYRGLTSTQKSGISPLIELTRGRKNHKNAIAKTGEEFNFGAVRQFIEDEIPKDQCFYLDVSKEPALSSSTTRELRDPSNSYRNWVSFVGQVRQMKPNVCPVMQINPPENQSWDDYKTAIVTQFDSLAQSSKMIAYRASAKNDNSFDADLIALSERISSFCRGGGVFRFFLDYDYIRPGTGELHAVEAAKILEAVHDICPDVSPVLVATSFPSSVTDLGGDSSGEFSEEEVIFHSTTSKLIHNRFAELIFGDYGSIHPKRNDEVIMANGWRPRIDFPFGGDRVFYYREQRKSEGKGKDKKFLTTYSHHYRSVANSVVSDSRFINDPVSKDVSCWGVEKVREAAQGGVPSSSPSFWISVRMNIHVVQQLRRLGLYQRPDSVFD